MSDRSPIAEAAAIGQYSANGCIAIIIAIVVAFAILTSGLKALGIDKLADEHRQRQQHVEQAYPTPQHSFSTQGKTHGEIAREEAKRIREERNRRFWEGR